jgi:hypothetical protein
MPQPVIYPPQPVIVEESTNNPPCKQLLAGLGWVQSLLACIIPGMHWMLAGMGHVQTGHTSQRCMLGWRTPQPRLKAVMVNNDEQALFGRSQPSNQREALELFIVIVDQ